MFSLHPRAKLKHFCALLIIAVFNTVFFQNATAQSASTTQGKPFIVDSIVAVVNQEVITKGELNERLLQVEKNLKEQGVALPPRDQMQKQLLEHMIVESAQVQMAKEMGIRVDDAQLDRTLAVMAEKDKMSVKEFQNKMEKEGISYASFRENVRREIMMHRLRDREVVNKIQISEAEVDNVLGTMGTSQQSSLEEVRLGHILIRIPENASSEQIASRRTRAEQVLQTLRSGGNFQQNAATYSDADDGLSGGDMGWRTYDRLPQLFAQAVASLRPGEISDILKSTNGFHILKVLDKRHTATEQPTQKNTAHMPVQQIHARHILIKVNNLVPADEARRKLVELKQRLDNNADTFENLARMYSNDLSANKGGDLGWIYPGDTVPEFEKAMVALKPGQISEPVETQFGFHLIQVLERKTDDMSDERKRIAIRNALRERKIEESTEEWVRQIRDNAYVEYRTDEK